MKTFPLRVLAFQLRREEAEVSESLTTARRRHEQDLLALGSAQTGLQGVLEQGRQLLAGSSFSDRRLQWEQITSWTDYQAQQVDAADAEAEKSRRAMEEAIRAMRLIRQRGDVLERRRQQWQSRLDQEIENKVHRELDEMAGGRLRG